MLNILVFLLLISIHNLHSLICYSNKIYYFSRNEFNWNNFSFILNQIENQIISNTSSCHVRITIDYNNNDKNSYVIINFTSSINSSNTHIEFGSTINFFQNNIQSIISYLDYICISEDLCEKIFLLKWAKQLLYADNNTLHNSFISLWKNSNICQIDKVTNKCASYLCFIIYDELKNLSYGKSQCNDKLSTNYVYIYIKTIGKYSNNYQCMKNHCINQVKYHNLTFEKNATEIIIINSINKNQNLNEIFSIRIICIISLLLIIGSIAYYIQCRKYKQGYRLAINK